MSGVLKMGFFFATIALNMVDSLKKGFNMDYANIASVAVAAIAVLISIFNGSKKNTKDDTMQIAMVMAKLDTMSDDLREVKKEMSGLRQKIDESHDKAILLERDMATMWKRIDELRTKVGEM